MYSERLLALKTFPEFIDMMIVVWDLGKVTAGVSRAPHSALSQPRGLK